MNMIAFTLLIVSATFLIVQAIKNETFCPSGFIQFENSCYHLNTEMLNYDAATHRCEDHFYGNVSDN